MSDQDKTEEKVKESSSEEASQDTTTASGGATSSGGSSQPGPDKIMDTLEFLLAHGLKVSKSDKPEVEQLLDEVNFDGIVKYMKSEKCKKVIVMVGAGISTSAGIPDFRSPGSGLYDNLQKYNLPSPQCMFDISFFKECPEPFYDLARELFPGKFKPTPCHYFLKLLNDKGLLTRLYTQNIDTLERVAGIPDKKLVEAHGTFYNSHCIKCRKKYSLQWMKEQLLGSEQGIPKCTECKSIVKPDIVFFGERLPDYFFHCVQRDFKTCDLLIIIGTSLTVQPFAGLIDNVPPETPRLLVNKEKCGRSNILSTMMGYSEGLDFDSELNYRDVVWLGLCDDGCQVLADALGWGEELKDLVGQEHERIDKEAEAAVSKQSEK